MLEGMWVGCRISGEKRCGGLASMPAPRPSCTSCGAPAAGAQTHPDHPHPLESHSWWGATSESNSFRLSFWDLGGLGRLGQHPVMPFIVKH